MHFLISLLISSVTCWLFSSMLFSLHMLEFLIAFLLFCSVQFSHSVVSDSLRPCESQHARPPCPSPSPRVHSNSCSSSQWCHPAISSSVVPFSSCPQSLPAWESFPMGQLFTWGGQSTLSNPMDCSPPGSSVHGIFQARVLEWGAIAFSVQGNRL